jgi:amidase
VLALAGLSASGGTAHAGPSFPAPKLAGIDLDRATIPELQRARRSGRISSATLTNFTSTGSGASIPGCTP